MIVYHYTTETSYDSIKGTGKFQPSNPWTTMDAAYGGGWYFTDLGPEKCEMFVMHICWRRVDVEDRVAYYLKFDIDESVLRKCRDHVYMVSQWNTNLIKYLGGGKNRPCGAKPCRTCDKAKKYLTR